MMNPGTNGTPQTPYVQQPQVAPPVVLTPEQRIQENQVGRGKWINFLIGAVVLLVLAGTIYVLAGASVSAVTSLAGVAWLVKGATVG